MTADNFCFYLQNRIIQTSQTGGQWYSDASPFSIPWCMSFCCMSTRHLREMPKEEMSLRANVRALQKLKGLETQGPI